MLLTKIGCVFFWFVAKNAKIIFMGPFWYLWCLSQVYWKNILHNWLSSNFWIPTRIFYHIYIEVFGAQTLRKLHLQRIYKGQTNHDNDQPNERNIYTLLWLYYTNFIMTLVGLCTFLWFSYLVKTHIQTIQVCKSYDELTLIWCIVCWYVYYY